MAQPRLVTDGDVKGGRYVSGMVDIYVGTGPASQDAQLRGGERVGEGVDGGQVPGQARVEVMPGGERVR